MPLVKKALEADLQEKRLAARALKLPGQGLGLNDLGGAPGVCGRQNKRSTNQTDARGRGKDKSVLLTVMTP